MKTCRVCKEAKPLDEFHRDKSSPDGRQYRCKTCAIAAARQWARDHPDQHRANMRKYLKSKKGRATKGEWREENRDKVLEAKRADWHRWRKANPGVMHERALRSRFKITVEEFDQMAVEQEGRCAVCSDELRYLAVDHCHESNRVRGLLCRHCNLGLGHFRDDPERLAAAITYLRAHAPG